MTMTFRLKSDFIRAAATRRTKRGRGQGQRRRVPGCDGAGTAERSYPSPRSGAEARGSHPAPEARGGSQEEKPHIQEAVAAWAQEGIEEICHVEGQEGWR